MDDDVAQQEIDVYLLGDEVIYRNGMRVPKEKLHARRPARASSTATSCSTTRTRTAARPTSICS